MKERKILSLFLVSLMVLSIVGTAVAEPSSNNGNGKGLLDRIRDYSHNNQTGDQNGVLGPNISEGASERFKNTRQNIVKASSNIKKMVRNVYSAQGFAIDGDEFHVVKMHVVGMYRVEAHRARELLDENVSISEISNEMQNREMKAHYLGRMRFGEDDYVLKVTELDRDQFKADIIDPPTTTSTLSARAAELNNSNIVGTVALRVYEHEGSIVCDGTIDLDGTEYRTLMYPLQPNLLKRNNGAINLGTLDVA
ncbi:MAG: hypothetical protein SVJ22_05540 [Halobacteriota archaeon]|nr:hypothetical protein [Halobacteriota archaeon]